MDKKPVIYGFVPHRLVVPCHPEYSFFPFNILFSSFARINGILKYGFALYEPNVEGFIDSGKELKMPYYNIYDRAPKNAWKIVITCHREKGTYTGEKYLNKSIVSKFSGNEWDNFFGQWTAHGLSDGESCYFRNLDDKKEKY